MADIINLLPETVSNQIAAGEVVKRPSSVLKELVENALDAGATVIKIGIVDAGKSLVQVIDNGKGMSIKDAHLCFERHATSKIKDAQDLFNLYTMGFRGEALASIAAVAQVDLRTRRAEDELGFHLVIEGGKIILEEPYAMTPGSTFTVKNLFFNIPVRRRFLKRDQTEMRNIITEFQNIALIRPDIEFRLSSNQDVVYDLLASGFKQRIKSVMGKNMVSITSTLIPVKVDTNLVKITGYVGRPDKTSQKTERQFFFVNGRFMKSPYFRKAVLQAYDRMIPAGQMPNYFIKMNVDPHTIDVNVHPTKTEIKFENDKDIYGILLMAVKEALGKFQVATTIDFDTEGEVETSFPGTEHHIEMPTIKVNSSYNPFIDQRNTFSRANPSSSQGGKLNESWKEVIDQQSPAMDFPMDMPSEPSNDITQEDTPEIMDHQVIERTVSSSSALFSTERALDQDILQYMGRFVFTSVKSGVMLMDLKHALMRITYDRLMHSIDKQDVVTQKLLFPETLEVDEENKLLYTEIEEDLKQVGFEIEPIDDRSYAIQGVPVLLSEMGSVLPLFEELFHLVKEGESNVKDSIHEKIVFSLAQTASQLQYNQLHFTHEMVNDLMSQLFVSSNPNWTPDGKRILTTISKEEILRRFS